MKLSWCPCSHGSLAGRIAACLCGHSKCNLLLAQARPRMIQHLTSLMVCFEAIETWSLKPLILRSDLLHSFFYWICTDAWSKLLALDRFYSACHTVFNKSWKLSLWNNANQKYRSLCRLPSDKLIYHRHCGHLEKLDLVLKWSNKPSCCSSGQ